MSVLSPVITDWINLGLKWNSIVQPKVVPRVLAPLEMYKVAQHQHPEGGIILFGSLFDSSFCGARLKASPGFDTERLLTINRLMFAGLVTSSPGSWVVVPPTTPPGIFCFHSQKEWPFLEYCEVYVYNDDPVNSHTCLGIGYNLVALEKPREVRSIEIEKKILDIQTEMLKTLKGGV